MVIKELLDIVEEALKMPFTYFMNPTKRIYVLYIFTTVLLAYYVYKRSKITGSFWSFLVPKKIWLSESTRVDAFLFFFNSFIKIIVIAPFLIIGLRLAFYTNEYLNRSFGFFEGDLSKTTLIITYTISLTLLNDLASFIVHYLQHKIPFLWEFHKIHHSATSLNPLTQYRIHPLELIMNNLKSIIIFGFVAGVFDYLSVDKMDKLTFIGVNVFSLVFLTFGANLRHSHIKLTYFNFLEYIFISPYQHQIHHSDQEEFFDKNMGSKLAVWDWLFGTLVRSNQIEKVTYGLGLNQDKEYTSFWNNLFNPFIKIFNKTVALFYIKK